MVITAVWVEGEDDVRLHFPNHFANRRFDLDHVHVRKRVWVDVPLAPFPRRIVESEEHRFADPEPRARDAKFFGA